MRVARITRPDRYFLLVRTGDEVLPWNEAVTFYAGARQYVKGGGDHGWTDFDDEVASRAALRRQRNSMSDESRGIAAVQLAFSGHIRVKFAQ